MMLSPVLSGNKMVDTTTNAGAAMPAQAQEA
jgi:hypothetical protein